MAGRRTPGLTTPAPGGRRAKASAVGRVTRRPSRQAARLLAIFAMVYADSARCSHTSFSRPGKTLAYVALDCVNHRENGQKPPNLIRGGPAARRRSARSAAWGRRAAGWPAGSQVARDGGASVGRSRLPSRARPTCVRRPASVRGMPGQSCRRAPCGGVALCPAGELRFPRARQRRRLDRACRSVRQHGRRARCQAGQGMWSRTPRRGRPHRGTPGCFFSAFPACAPDAVPGGCCAGLVVPAQQPSGATE